MLGVWLLAGWYFNGVDWPGGAAAAAAGQRKFDAGGHWACALLEIREYL
jgi:hypothetical protein